MAISGKYERTVKAALALESNSTEDRKRLCEALALDIPRRSIGGSSTQSGEEIGVDSLLLEANDAIVAAGGESLSIGSLRINRGAAMFVTLEDHDLRGVQFRWVDNVSISVHVKAWKQGLTYDEFVSMPSKTQREVERLSIQLRSIKCSECSGPTGEVAKNRELAKAKSKSALCQECFAKTKPEPAKVAATATAFTSRTPVTPSHNAGPEETQTPTLSKPRPSYVTVPETPEQAKARRDKGRKIHQEVQHAAMLNGRPGSSNHLLTNELRKLSARLGDFADKYTPRDAAYQIPDRQLQWFCDDDRAEWLLEFFRECNKRRLAEVPELEPRSPRSEESSRYRNA